MMIDVIFGRRWWSCFGYLGEETADEILVHRSYMFNGEELPIWSSLWAQKVFAFLYLRCQ